MDTTSIKPEEIEFKFEAQDEDDQSRCQGDNSASSNGKLYNSDTEADNVGTESAHLNNDEIVSSKMTTVSITTFKSTSYPDSQPFPGYKKQTCKKFYRCIEANCNRTFNSIASLDALITHLRLDHGGIQMCKYCGQRFQTWPKLFAHFETNHPEILLGKVDWICPHCPQYFSKQNLFIVHLNSYHGVPLPVQGKPPKTYNKRRQCTYCKTVKFPTMIKLVAHLKKKHGIEKCVECGKIMPDSQTLNKHLASVHKKELEGMDMEMLQEAGNVSSKGIKRKKRPTEVQEGGSSSLTKAEEVKEERKKIKQEEILGL